MATGFTLAMETFPCVKVLGNGLPRATTLAANRRRCLAIPVPRGGCVPRRLCPVNWKSHGRNACSKCRGTHRILQITTLPLKQEVWTSANPAYSPATAWNGDFGYGICRKWHGWVEISSGHSRGIRSLYILLEGRCRARAVGSIAQADPIVQDSVEWTWGGWRVLERLSCGGCL